MSSDDRPATRAFKDRWSNALALWKERRRGQYDRDFTEWRMNMGARALYRAITAAKLEPYLGFLHSEQFGKPSLVCDLMEPYRCLIDDFVIQYCMSLKKRDFEMKREDYSSNRKGEREYLNKALAKDMMRRLNSFFESTIEIPRVRHGNKQTVETLINEETMLFARYLRDEKPTWTPRIIGNARLLLRH